MKKKVIPKLYYVVKSQSLPINKELVTCSNRRYQPSVRLFKKEVEGGTFFFITEAKMKKVLPPACSANPSKCGRHSKSIHEKPSDILLFRSTFPGFRNFASDSSSFQPLAASFENKINAGRHSIAPKTR